MTAFDNIKTNNWPASSNDFEDFLVLKMPLNDLDSLTESLPVAAGSQELFPKRTLTNGQVRPKASGLSYSSLISGTVDSSYPLSNLFGGTIGPGYVNGTRSTNPGSLTLNLSSLNITVDKVRLYTYVAGSPTLEVNGSAVSVLTGDRTTEVTVNGQLNSIEWSYDSVHGPYCYMRGIEVDYGDGNGYQLLTDAPGGTKKHYDNNAYFDSNAYLQLAAADSVFDLGTDDFCIEYFFKADNLSSAYKLFQLGTEINWTENIEMRMTTSGTINYDIYPGGSVATDNYGFTGTQTFTAGTWNHVAFTRQGSTFRGFLNGVADGSATYAGTISSPTPAHHRPTFGARTNGSVTTIQGPRLVGSIQDFRLYKGTAKYTSNFTPPGAILD